MIEESKKINYCISLVMPVYNEEDIIEKVIRSFCEEVLEYFKNKKFIIINDKSTDNTGKILGELKKEYPYIEIINHKENKGHGPSVYDGLRTAVGEYILQCDSDGQFDPRDFWKMWAKMKQDNLDFVIGWRKKRHDSIIRLAVTKFLRLAILLRFYILIKDANSPFRLYKKTVVEKILPTLSKRPLIPSILMAISVWKFGYKTAEVPVIHLPRETGMVSIRRIKLLKFVLGALRELWRYNVLL